jgi:hypothetical protein
MVLVSGIATVPIEGLLESATILFEKMERGM